VDGLLTFNDAARSLAVSLRQFRRFVDDQRIPVVRVSARSPRVRTSDVQAFIEQNLRQTPPHHEPGAAH